MSVAESKRPPSIGLSTIWQDGTSLEKLSFRAILGHIARRSYENILRSPVTSILTVVTIAFSLFLLGVFLLLLHNIRGVVTESSKEVSVSIFLKDGIKDADISSLKERFSSDTDVNQVDFRSKSKALEFFRKSLGDDSKILDGLDDDNPLPASVELKLTNGVDADNVFAKIAHALKDDPRVDQVRYSRGLAVQLKRMLRAVEVFGTVAILFLLVITGFIISNTINLALYSHRAEIEIMQLVGAERWAIQAPYVIEGIFQGVLGGLVSITLVFLSYLFVQDALVETDVLRFLFPQFSFLSGGAVVLVCLAGMVVGAVGSYLAVKRFLLND